MKRWIIYAATVVLSGCTSVRYVPVETIRTEYRDGVREVGVTDSVSDTRIVYVKGDSVIEMREKIRWRERLVHDSVYVEHRDTIGVPYPVEKELTLRDRAKMTLGGAAMGAVAVVLALVGWRVRKRG